MFKRWSNADRSDCFACCNCLCFGEEHRASEPPFFIYGFVAVEIGRQETATGDAQHAELLNFPLVSYEGGRIQSFYAVFNQVP
jgi:hypothetical protein